MTHFGLTEWPQYLTEWLASGFVATLGLWIATSVATILFALPVAAMRSSRVWPLRMVAIAYIELFRGTPLLVQLIVFFAAVPVLTGIYLAPWPTAVLAITLNSGSYLAESYRSGVNAVPYGQREAALSLGIPTLRIWTRVILPQAVRIILPSIGTILVSILMGTSFAYLVGVVDLMARATGLYAISNDFSVYYLTTLLYAVAAVVLAIGFSMLERRLRLQ